MHFAKTSVEGAMVIDPAPHVDARGRFMRAWCLQEFAEQGIAFEPVQANMGISTKRGTIRGMHFQEAPDGEAKLVRCTRGAMFDVVPRGTDHRNGTGQCLKRPYRRDAGQ